jgi:hypothetical protein
MPDSGDSEQAEIRENWAIAVDCLAALDGLLSDYGTAFEDAVEKHGTGDEPPSYAFRWGFQFGQLTNTLVRPFYELSARLLWAARQEHGWERFLKTVAREDLNWARRAEKLPNLSGVAHMMKASRQEVLDRVTDDGKALPEMPSLRDVLRDNSKRDVELGEDAAPGSADLQYTSIYSMLCRPSHGNIQAAYFQTNMALMLTIFASGFASWALIRALFHYVQADPKDFRFNETSHEILRVLEAVNGFSPDDPADAEQNSAAEEGH